MLRAPFILSPSLLFCLPTAKWQTAFFHLWCFLCLSLKARRAPTEILEFESSLPCALCYFVSFNQQQKVYMWSSMYLLSSSILWPHFTWKQTLRFQSPRTSGVVTDNHFTPLFSFLSSPTINNSAYTSLGEKATGNLLRTPAYICFLIFFLLKFYLFLLTCVCVFLFVCAPHICCALRGQ